MALTEAAKRALSQAEANLLSNEAQLAKEAPEQLARIKSILQEVRAGKVGSEKIKAQVMELMKWQFGLQRDSLKKQIAQLAPKAASDPAAKKSEAALKRVVEMLDKAEKAMTSPSEAAQKALTLAGEQAKTAVAEAQQAIARSTVGIPMKPVTGPIVSSSGVALKPVVSTKAAPKKPVAAVPAGSLAAFKVRPGTGPAVAAPTKGKPDPKRRS